MDRNDSMGIESRPQQASSSGVSPHEQGWGSRQFFSHVTINTMYILTGYLLFTKTPIVRRLKARSGSQPPLLVCVAPPIILATAMDWWTFKSSTKPVETTQGPVETTQEPQIPHEIEVSYARGWGLHKGFAMNIALGGLSYLAVRPTNAGRRVKRNFINIQTTRGAIAVSSVPVILFTVIDCFAYNISVQKVNAREAWDQKRARTMLQMQSAAGPSQNAGAEFGSEEAQDSGDKWA